MEVTWTYKMKIFEVNDGPTRMLEELNTEGQDGWEVASIINVQGETDEHGNQLSGDKLATLLKKGHYTFSEITSRKESNEALKLWSGVS
jgi:hypothetical protein